MTEHEKLFMGCLGEALKVEKGEDQGGPGNTEALGAYRSRYQQLRQRRKSGASYQIAGQLRLSV